LLSGWTFRRGFLDAVCVPAATYLRHRTIPCPATVRRVEVDLEGFGVPADVLELVPGSVVYENVVLPVGLRGRTLVLAVQDPLDADLLGEMRFILNRDVEAVAAPGRQVAEAIRRHHGDPVFRGGEPDLLGWLSSPPAFPPDEVDLGSWGNGSPVARLLARIVAAAVSLNAREVHVGRGPDRVRVRFTCDGGAAEGEVTPVQFLWPLTTRLRILAGIWGDDPREVQAGTIRMTARGRRTDVGVVIRRTNGDPAVVLTFRQ
jgi:type IV pilus assembly protein PilB